MGKRPEVHLFLVVVLAAVVGFAGNYIGAEKTADKQETLRYVYGHLQ